MVIVKLRVSETTSRYSRQENVAVGNGIGAPSCKEGHLSDTTFSTVGKPLSDTFRHFPTLAAQSLTNSMKNDQKNSVKSSVGNYFRHLCCINLHQLIIFCNRRLGHPECRSHHPVEDSFHAAHLDLSRK